jgi:hypothetical protein
MFGWPLRKPHLIDGLKLFTSETVRLRPDIWEKTNTADEDAKSL